jgi:hypothetical protein
MSAANLLFCRTRGGASIALRALNRSGIRVYNWLSHRQGTGAPERRTSPHLEVCAVGHSKQSFSTAVCGDPKLACSLSHIASVRR